MGKTKEMAMALQEEKAPTFEEAAAMVQAAITKTDNGDNVHSALLAIQLRLKAPKNQVNNFAHFNYRTAGQILEAVKPILAETGCTLTLDDEVVLIGDRYYVHTTATLHHIATGFEVKNNGWAREAANEKGKMDPQMTGGASTFAKKYALGNLFCIDDSADDPDATSGQTAAPMQTDRVQQAINALNTAQTADEVAQIKTYFFDVLNLPQVIEAGKACKQRLNY